jgi:hypothetical protein
MECYKNRYLMWMEFEEEFCHRKILLLVSETGWKAKELHCNEIRDALLPEKITALLLSQISEVRAGCSFCKQCSKYVLCVTNKELRSEDVWGSGCIDPHFLDPGFSWRWVVSFTPRPLYSRGKSSQYPLDRRLNEPQNRYGRRGEEKSLSPIGTRTPVPRPSSPQPVAIPNTLYPCFQLA